MLYPRAVLSRFIFKALPVASLLSLFPLLAHSQVDTAWVRRYPGPGGPVPHAFSNALALDTSGNVYVTGLYALGPFLSHFLTIKYSSAGDSLWVKTYNGTGDSTDVANDIALDSHGNVYVTGSSWGIGTWEDYATIKYNSLGNQRWVARYDGPAHGQDFPLAMVVDPSGNVFVTGGSQRDSTSFAEDYATVKYDSLGYELWARRYRGPGIDDHIACALALDDSGNLYVTGYSSNARGRVDCATIKYNSSGDTLWVRRYPDLLDYTGRGRAIALDHSGHVYVAGSSNVFGNLMDYFIIKYNTAGDTLWVRHYDGPISGDDIARDMAINQAGNVYVTGYSPSSGDPADYATVKYDSTGNQCWVARYAGPAHDWDVANCIAVDAQRNVYVTGYSHIGLHDTSAYTTIKYDSLGGQAWVALYQGPVSGANEAFGLAVDAQGYVYITGFSTRDIIGYADMATIKYRQVVGVEEAPFSSARFPFRLSFSPNPIRDNCGISFALPISQKVALAVYDALGRKVRVLLDEEVKAGSQRVRWVASDDQDRPLPSGVYFLRLEAGGSNLTRKVVLIR